jgi:hypothetical protein
MKEKNMQEDEIGFSNRNEDLRGTAEELTDLNEESQINGGN